MLSPNTSVSPNVTEWAIASRPAGVWARMFPDLGQGGTSFRKVPRYRPKMV